MEESLSSLLSQIAREHGVCTLRPWLKGRFHELLEKLYLASGLKCVVLVDEYDKPIIDHIEEPGKAGKNRDLLREFFSVLKSADEYIVFALLTGVSKFSKVSVFSGLNNLTAQPEAP